MEAAKGAKSMEVEKKDAPEGAVGGEKRSKRDLSSSPSRSRSREKGRRSSKDVRGSRSPQRHFSGRGGGYGQQRRYREVELPGLDGPLLSMRDFMERQKETLSYEKADEIYNNYKKKWEQKQNDIFFNEHKNDEWFREKYEPLLAAKLAEERRAQAKQNSERFAKSLESNQFERLNLEIDDSVIDKKGESAEAGAEKMGIEEEGGDKPRKNQPFHEVYLKESIDITGAPYFGFDPNSMTLFIRSIPKNISRWDLEAALQKVPGFVSLSLSEPLKTQDFLRFGWILFDSEDKCNKAQSLLSNLTIKDFLFTVVKSKSHRRAQKVVCSSTNERNEEDLALSKQLIETLDKEKSIGDNHLLKNAGSYSHTKLLDLQLLYLRRVHSYCFYCGTEYHDERLLSAKCGPIHLRMKGKGEESKDNVDIPDWHKRVTEIIRKRIEESKTSAPAPETVQGATDEIQQAFEDYLGKSLEEDQGKFGCPFCDKYFAGQVYVIKHIKNKHDDHKSVLDIKRKVLEKLIRRNYARDKSRITNTPSSYQRSSFNYRRGGRQQSNYQSSGPREYRDLDDPKRAPVQASKGNRSVIDYADL